MAGLDCHVARGRCSGRLSGAEAYRPILEGLGSLTRGARAEIVRKILVDVAPGWWLQMADSRSASLPSAVHASDAASSSQERRKREFISFVECLTREQPLILFIDDVHWADVSTIDLLSYAILHARSLPV